MFLDYVQARGNYNPTMIYDERPEDSFVLSCEKREKKTSKKLQELDSGIESHNKQFGRE